MLVRGSSRSVVSLRYDCFISKNEHQTGKFRVDFQESCIDIDKLLKVILVEVLHSCILLFCIVHRTNLQVFTCANQFTFIKLFCTYSYIFVLLQ